MADRIINPKEQRQAMTFALLAGPARTLALHKRVPALLRARGWTCEPDVVAVLTAALSLTKVRAGLTIIRRPPAAGGLGGKWPEEITHLLAREIVNLLELDDLLEAV